MFTRLGLFDRKQESRRAALLDFCAQTLDVATKRLALAHDPLGAPLLVMDGTPSVWRLSSSSRENVFLFGLAREARIGVDVEIVRPIEPPEAALHPRERERLNLGAEVFYELWTVKEAYVKALGVGFRRDPAKIEVLLGERLALADAGRPVALAGARLWRERIDGKQAVCAALTL